MKKELPKVGKFYNHYDDGKVSEGRQMKSFITNISLNKEGVLDTDELEDIKWCDFLYSQESDYIIEADLFTGSKVEKIKYVRTIDGRWFSLGWWAGVLDVDNKLTEDLKKYYESEGYKLSNDYYNENK